jgi:hypothetical protein
MKNYYLYFSYCLSLLAENVYCRHTVLSVGVCYK